MEKETKEFTIVGIVLSVCGLLFTYWHNKKSDSTAAATQADAAAAAQQISELQDELTAQQAASISTNQTTADDTSAVAPVQISGSSSTDTSGNFASSLASIVQAITATTPTSLSGSSTSVNSTGGGNGSISTTLSNGSGNGSGITINNPIATPTTSNNGVVSNPVISEGGTSFTNVGGTFGTLSTSSPVKSINIES